MTSWQRKDMLGRLKAMTANTVRHWIDGLTETGEEIGCCRLEYADDDKHIYSALMGWHDLDGKSVIAWKIGRQPRNRMLQCDFDIDFEMPFDPDTGEVDDTLNVIGAPTKRKVNETVTILECPPVDYDGVAKEMRREARRIADKWLRRLEE